MRRKRTPNTRTANAAEKKFLAWVKEQDCAVCGMPGPSIADHVWGATFKHMKTLIGMWALLPLCPECDEVKTKGSLRGFVSKFGALGPMILNVISESPFTAPDDVLSAIEDWGK